MTGTTAQPGAPAPRGQRAVVPGQRAASGGSAADARGVAARRTRTALDSARASLRGTPGQLRVVAIASVIACLAFAALAFAALQARASALAQAQAHAAQLVRIQQIAADLVEADSQFTNGYLTFGQDSAAQLDTYDRTISDASQLLATAAQAEPGDAKQLAAVSDALSQYTARVASARANNRQGFQVGVGYLRQASSLLRSDSSSVNLLPNLDRLVADNAGRVDDAFSASRSATWLLVLAGLLGLGVLLAGQVWVALHSHRMLNVPLVAATVAVLVGLVGGGVTMVSAQSKADDVKSHSFAATLALANAKIAAYVGKSYQSITLIYIGTGGDYPTSQKAYQDEIATAKSQLAAAATTIGDAGSQELATWTAANDRLYQQAQSDWVKAAGAATSTADGSVNADFAAFDRASSPVLNEQAAAVDDGLGGTHTLLIVLAWVALLLGVVAAGASWLGVSLRLEEYR